MRHPFTTACCRCGRQIQMSTGIENHQEIYFCSGWCAYRIDEHTLNMRKLVLDNMWKRAWALPPVFAMESRTLGEWKTWDPENMKEES